MHSEQFSTTLPPSLRQSDSFVNFLQKPPIQQHFLPNDVPFMVSLLQACRLFIKYKQPPETVNPDRKEMARQVGDIPLKPRLYAGLIESVAGRGGIDP